MTKEQMTERLIPGKLYIFYSKYDHVWGPRGLPTGDSLNASIPLNGPVMFIEDVLGYDNDWIRVLYKSMICEVDVSSHTWERLL